MRVAKELSPNFTGFPNVLTDRLMAAAGPSRWALITVIVRKTYGWHQESAAISLAEFEAATGLGRQAIIFRLRQLEEAGLVVRTRNTPRTAPFWELNLEGEMEDILAALPPIRREQNSAPASVISTLPPSVISTLPPSVISTLPPSVISTQNDVSQQNCIKESIKENKNLSRVAKNATREGEEIGNEKAQPVEPEADPRHAPLRQAIQAMQRAAVGSEIWDGRCAGALGRMLKARSARQWPLQRLLECAGNRFASDVNHAMTPAVWLAALTDYANGPLDRYGKQRRPDEWAMKAAVGAMPRKPEPKPKRNFEKDLADSVEELLAMGGLSFRSLDGAAWRAQLLKAAADADVNQHSFQTWLLPVRALAIRADGTGILLAPNENWGYVREKYGDVLREALGVADFQLVIWDENAEGNPWVPI